MRRVTSKYAIARDFIFRQKMHVAAELRPDPLRELKRSPDFIFRPHMHQKPLVAGLRSLISQLSACHEPKVDHHLYADDTQLFISFSPHAAHAALDSLHAILDAISQWMASNFLTLNPSKN